MKLQYLVAQAAYQLALTKYNDLLTKWNDLVETLNSKGGEKFLEEAKIRHAHPLSAEEVKKLISLCHPDKHDGSHVATEMTQRLLDIRGDLDE